MGDDLMYKAMLFCSEGEDSSPFIPSEMWGELAKSTPQHVISMILYLLGNSFHSQILHDPVPF